MQLNPSWARQRVRGTKGGGRGSHNKFNRGGDPGWNCKNQAVKLGTNRQHEKSEKLLEGKEQFKNTTHPQPCLTRKNWERILRSSRRKTPNFPDQNHERGGKKKKNKMALAIETRVMGNEGEM